MQLLSIAVGCLLGLGILWHAGRLRMCGGGFVDKFHCNRLHHEWLPPSLRVMPTTTLIRMRQFYLSSIIIWCMQRYSISNHLSQLLNRVTGEHVTKVFGIPFDQLRCGSSGRLPYSVHQQDPPVQRLNYEGRHLLHRLSQSGSAGRPEESESHYC